MTGTTQPQRGQQPAESASLPAPSSSNRKLAVYLGANATFALGIAVLLFAIGGGGSVAGGTALCIVATVLGAGSSIARDPGRAVKLLRDHRDRSIRRLGGA